MKNKEKAPFSRGAYYVVRNPQNYPTETFFGGDPAQGAFDAVIRPTLSYSLNIAIWMQNAKAPPPIGVPTKYHSAARTLCGEKEQPRAGQRKDALSSGFLAV